MLEQHARVIENLAAGVWVEAVEPAGCGICAGQGCATRQLAELFQRSPRRYRVESHFRVSAGDRVIVGVPDGSLTRSALTLYGLPLVLILAGALFGQTLVPGDAAAVMGAVAGGLVSWGLATLNSAGHGALPRPAVIRREARILETNK